MFPRIPRLARLTICHRVPSFDRYQTYQDSVNVYMLLSYVPGGELFSHLRRAGRFTPDVTRFYLSSIILAVACEYTTLPACPRRLEDPPAPRFYAPAREACDAWGVAVGMVLRRIDSDPRLRLRFSGVSAQTSTPKTSSTGTSNQKTSSSTGKDISGTFYLLDLFGIRGWLDRYARCRRGCLRLNRGIDREG